MNISDTLGTPRGLLTFPLSIFGWVGNDESDKISDSSLIRIRPLVSYGFARISANPPSRGQHL
jgi:hypothetical protein